MRKAKSIQIFIHASQKNIILFFLEYPVVRAEAKFALHQ